MQDIAKALCLFFVGLVILVTFGDAFFKEDRRPKAASASEIRPRLDGQRQEEALAERPDPPASVGSYAQACSAYDPIAHPEQVIDILEYASETTGTPVDVLYSVWQKETGFLDGAGVLSGGCNVMHELETYRDPAAGTHHAQAMLAMGKRFGWDKQYGERLERMTCSCPSKDKETGARKGFGGSCGPFQFSGEEIDDEYALPLNLDPMRFCEGALIAGWELKKHHDDAFTPHKNRWGQVIPGRGTTILANHPGYTREQAAWQGAMSRYYGSDAGGIYGDTAIAKWVQFHAWYEEDQRRPGFLVAKILGLGNTQYSIRKLGGHPVAYVSD